MNENETKREITRNNISIAEKHYEGIKGLLLLVAIGLVTSFLINISNLIEIIQFSENKSNAYFTEHFHSFFNLAVKSQYALVIINVILIILFFKKKEIFPKTIILVLVLNIIVSILLYSNFHEINSDFSVRNFQFDRPGENEQHDLIEKSLFQSILKTCVICFIGTLYFLKSRRVKNTFVN